ncbi:hypothetical protein Tco_0856058 [Tanacetum coccineum]
MATSAIIMIFNQNIPVYAYVEVAEAMREDSKFLMDYPRACTISTSQAEELKKQIGVVGYVECSSKTQQEHIKDGLIKLFHFSLLIDSSFPFFVPSDRKSSPDRLVCGMMNHWQRKGEKDTSGAGAGKSARHRFLT